MKVTIIFSTLIFLFLSCDERFCTSYNIKNNTDTDLILYLNEQSFNINRGEIYALQEYDCKLGGLPPLEIQEYDSVYFKNTNDELLLVYKSNNPGENIYDYINSWHMKHISNHSYEHVFEITDEDIKQE